MASEKPVRVGLYLMVLICLVNSCEANYRTANALGQQTWDQRLIEAWFGDDRLD